MSKPDTEEPPEIVIKVDGKLALTVQMIAAQYGLARNSVATVIEREQVPVAAMLDGKKAVYFATDVKRAMAARPGHGWRKGKGYTPGSGEGAGTRSAHDAGIQMPPSEIDSAQ